MSNWVQFGSHVLPWSDSWSSPIHQRQQTSPSSKFQEVKYGGRVWFTFKLNMYHRQQNVGTWARGNSIFLSAPCDKHINALIRSGLRHFLLLVQYWSPRIRLFKNSISLLQKIPANLCIHFCLVSASFSLPLLSYGWFHSIYWSISHRWLFIAIVDTDRKSIIISWHCPACQHCHDHCLSVMQPSTLNHRSQL